MYVFEFDGKDCELLFCVHVLVFNIILSSLSIFTDKCSVSFFFPISGLFGGEKV